jgi:hypothetical protein
MKPGAHTGAGFSRAAAWLRLADSRLDAETAFSSNATSSVGPNVVNKVGAVNFARIKRRFAADPYGRPPTSPMPRGGAGSSDRHQTAWIRITGVLTACPRDGAGDCRRAPSDRRREHFYTNRGFGKRLPGRKKCSSGRYGSTSHLSSG